MCTAFAITEENSVELAWLIEAHHEAFVKLYGKERVTPKMHFMVHLATQLKRYTNCTCYNDNHSNNLCRFGPHRNTSCMRFEAKNSQMKGYLHGNYKNVPFSVATRHQEWLCAQLLSSTSFFTVGDQYSGKIIITYSYIIIYIQVILTHHRKDNQHPRKCS